ncbi:MAG: tRNA lysidine(34) synthetase TilS [Cyanobacteria bacterium J06626_4]
MTWSALHAHLHQTLRSRTTTVHTDQPQPLLPPQARVLVAVSGGQDSQCLLRLLIDLQPKWHWQLYGIHCNHRWRADADANAAFVHQLTTDWGVPCQVKTAVQPLTSEATARQWRYQVFAEVAHQIGCTHVVTGHTASDRAETLLFNLVRGSGLDGLQALTWCRPLNATATDLSLVRPLLDVTRTQTQQFCETWQIPIWEDATNTDPTYRRNRLRLDILPPLREHFNPQVDATLAQTAEILTAEVEYLHAQMAIAFAQCVVQGRLQRRSLREMPLALQRRVIRQLLMQQLQISPQFAQVDKVIALLDAPNRSQSDPFPGGAIAMVDDPWIVVQPPS